MYTQTIYISGCTCLHLKPQYEFVKKLHRYVTMLAADVGVSVTWTSQILQL